MILYVHFIPCGECQTPPTNPYSPSFAGSPVAPCPSGGSFSNGEQAVEINQEGILNYFDTSSGRTLASATLSFDFYMSTDAASSVSDVNTIIEFYMSADIASLDAKINTGMPVASFDIVTLQGGTNSASTNVPVDVSDILSDLLNAGPLTHKVYCTTVTANIGDDPVIIDVTAGFGGILTYVCT